MKTIPASLLWLVTGESCHQASTEQKKMKRKASCLRDLSKDGREKKEGKKEERKEKQGRERVSTLLNTVTKQDIFRKQGEREERKGICQKLLSPVELFQLVGLASSFCGLGERASVTAEKMERGGRN